MFLADSGPQVQVTVNNVLGTCQGNCAYNFITSVPEVTSQSLSGAQLTIAINDVNTDNYALTNLKVKLGDQICSNLAGSFASFTCDLPQNSDNTPTMEAGSYIAEVIVENVGIVSTANSVTALNFPFAVTSASPNSVPAQGGSQVTIAGTGLPLNVADAELSICGQTVAAKSTNNIATVFIMPSCAEGTQTLTYTFGSYSGTVSITVSAASTTMEITSISPTSSSPSEKGVLDINGNNLPTDISTISVSLVGATKTYNMKVLSSTGTLVKAGIPGGIEGAYKVVLTVG